MKPILKLLAAAAALAASTAVSPAQDTQPAAPQAQQPACLAPDYSGTGRMSWFLGMHPSDDLLSTWCRIQTLPGAVRFNVYFPVTGAHRSWDTSFEGGTLPATRIVEIIQSLLPTGDGPAKDENGMEFPKVLSNVVQLAAESAPDNTRLAFAQSHPAARELALWEPVMLRVKPVALAGQEFVLTATLRPNLGLLALALQGKATDVRLQGWKGRMQMGGFFGSSCSAAIPFCHDAGEVVTFHAPWILTEVRLDAQGDNMTEAAAAIMNRLSSSSRSRFIKEGLPPVLDPATGEGTLQMTDGISSMEMRAIGSPGGTKSISIVWKEGMHELSVAKQLEDAGNTYRTGAAPKHSAPPVPDSLGRL